MKNESLEHYLSLNYAYELTRDIEQGGYFATHPDLDGCAAQGETADEAIEQLDVARELWIETRLEDGLPVPEPVQEEPSGRISLRMPSSLHAKLIRIADRQGVSLNLVLNSILAEYVGGIGAQIAIRDAVRELVQTASGERYGAVRSSYYVNEVSDRD